MRRCRIWSAGSGMTVLMPRPRSRARWARDEYALSARSAAGVVRGRPGPRRGTRSSSSRRGRAGLSRVTAAVADLLEWSRSATGRAGRRADRCALGVRAVGAHRRRRASPARSSLCSPRPQAPNPCRSSLTNRRRILLKASQGGRKAGIGPNAGPAAPNGSRSQSWPRRIAGAGAMTVSALVRPACWALQQVCKYSWTPTCY